MIAVKLPEGVWSNNYRFPILELIIKKKSDILIVELDLTTIAYASIKAVRLVHEINLHGGILHFFNYKLLIVYAWDAYFVLWSEKKNFQVLPAASKIDGADEKVVKILWRRDASSKIQLPPITPPLCLPLVIFMTDWRVRIFGKIRLRISLQSNSFWVKTWKEWINGRPNKN